MALQPGSRLGPYEILAPIGAGGMGEVYRARDTQLGREVAIKTISPSFAANEERKRRFLQEARAASALNHPGIVTIYDISRTGDLDYIVMEYVRGQTLDRLTGKQGLGIQEAIGYALQITDSLARAHAVGIVHRDLKPGNLMVTPEGQVKILDFGLAKLGDAEVIGPSDATLTARLSDGPLSREGVIAGTVAYMSPEQAEGKKVDARSDIFSFGAVLYEMLTGRRAFTGDTPASTLAAVLKSDPASPAELVDGIPRDLERIVMRCLRKELPRRFQHVADLRVDLEELRETSRSGEIAPVTVARKPRRWVWIGAAVACAAIAGVAWLMRPATGKSGAAGFEAVPLTSYPGRELYPSFSPDGSQVVFSWDGSNQDNMDIYVTVVGTGTPLRLTTDAAADSYPAWSPDGRQVAFIRQGRGILVIPPIGGSERMLWEGPASGSISWTPDGKYVVFALPAQGSDQAGLFAVPAQGGALKRLTAGSGRDPSFSPDGRRLAFGRCSSLTSCKILIVEVDEQLRASERVEELTAASSVFSTVWTPSGNEILYTAGLTPSNGEAWRVAARRGSEPQNLRLGGPGTANLTISRSGMRLAYSAMRGDTDLWTLENGASSRSPVSSTLQEYNPQISPDGRRIAFTSHRTGSSQVWVANRDGSSPLQLTFLGQSGTPRWSPDGTRIVYDTQMGNDQRDISIVNSSGGQPALLVRHPATDRIPSFSWDGKWVYFSSNRSGRDNLYRVSIGGGEPVQLTDNGGYVAFEGIDGKTIYYLKSGGGCTPLFERLIEGGPERQVIDRVCARGFQVTERGIYYMTSDGPGYEIRVLDTATGRSSAVGRIRERIRPDLGLAVSLDGNTVIYSAGESSADLMLVENFR